MPGQQAGFFDRLGHMSITSSDPAPIPIFPHGDGEGGEGDNGRARPTPLPFQLPDPPDGGTTVHDRHLQVHAYQIITPGLKHFQRSRTISGHFRATRRVHAWSRNGNGVADRAGRRSFFFQQEFGQGLIVDQQQPNGFLGL